MSNHPTRIAGTWALLMFNLALGAFAAPVSAQSALPGTTGMPPAAMLLQQMHMANLVQIKAAKIAKQKAGNDPTWHLADRLWRDHQVADGKVRMLAGKLGYQLKSPTQMQQMMMQNVQPAQASSTGAPQKMQQIQQKIQMMQEMMAKLQETPAPQFDQVYAKAMLKSQQNMLQMLQQAQMQAKPPVQKLVSVLIPILSQHVELAQGLAGMTPAAGSGAKENSQ